MQGDTTNELHVVVHHVPLYAVSGGHPVVFPDDGVALNGHIVFGCDRSELAIEIACRHAQFRIFFQSTSGFANDGEGFGQNFLEYDFQFAVNVFFEFIDLCEDGFFLFEFGSGQGLCLNFQLSDFLFFGCNALCNCLLEFLAAAAQFVMANACE